MTSEDEIPPLRVVRRVNPRLVDLQPPWNGVAENTQAPR